VSIERLGLGARDILTLSETLILAVPPRLPMTRRQSMMHNLRSFIPTAS
jgi:hypothetical protein